MIPGRMPNDPAAWTGRGGDGDPTIAPFTADHTPNPGATTSITDELTGVPREAPAPTGGGGGVNDQTIAPEVTAADAGLVSSPA